VQLVSVMAALDITFRGMTPSPSVEVAIGHWVERLEQVYGRIHRCAVVLELPHLHHRRGNRFHVRIDIAVPGREIVVSHDSARGDHGNAYAALADAFRAARRRLADHAQVRRGGPRHRAALAPIGV
jgi:ribosome-associated translation inhibitor RaiA